MSEIKLIISGPMGAGKTTAIRALSEIEPISTEVANTDKREHSKTDTTVALDYGERTLSSGEKLRIYGTPGQARFDFMWRILAEDALGVILLLDNSRSEPLQDLRLFVSAFTGLIARGALVVAVGRMESHPVPTLDDYIGELEKLDLWVPVMPADVRRADDVAMVCELLFQQLESNDDGDTESTRLVDLLFRG